MSYIISVDKSFKSVEKASKALAYWTNIGRTVRIAKASNVDGRVAVNMDFLVEKGDEALAFGPNAGYKVNSTRSYDFNAKTFLAKGLKTKTVTTTEVVLG